MTPSTYEQLLKWVAPIIQKKATKMRQPIEPSERLCVTLRYCVTGDAHVTIAENYRISPSCVGRIIAETCQAIWSVICKEGFLDVPCTENEWTSIANEFAYKWNFPHAIGALDGNML